MDMKKKIALALLLAIGLCGCEDFEHHDVAYYLAHPDERAAEIQSGVQKSVNDPGEAATDVDANFTNAFAAQVYAGMGKK